MRACPKCQSTDIHFSRARSNWEHWRKRLTGKRPFRCRACKWRGWGVDHGPSFSEAEIERAARAIAPEPPNLKGTVLAKPSNARDVDFRALDQGLVEDDKPSRTRRALKRR